MLLLNSPRLLLGPVGATAANLASAGDFICPLGNDLPELPGRSTAQALWKLLAPLPSSGTTRANDLGAYNLFKPGDGTYVQWYRGYFVQPALSTVYSESITNKVGAGGDTASPEMVGVITVSALTSVSYTTSIEPATDNIGVTAYQVSQDGGSTWIHKGTTRTHNHTGRPPGATDQVRWRAGDAAGYWANPLAIAVTLPSPPLPPVSSGPISAAAYFQMMLRAAS
ncbi:hypothetical protein [Variovorax sp. HJSM1_2]|uniref:hypothetical protein n=1 Tax=Variovorax sp. HJSM1_2 TaxID=3366263 RepID=UPI003BDEEF5E